MRQEKKNIDRLFQEKFKDFEVTPDEAVWQKIKERQTKNKKKRVVIIPLWFRIAGAAALIVLLFSIGSVWKTDDNKQPVVTDTNSLPTNTVTEKESMEDSIRQHQLVEETEIKKNTIVEETKINPLKNTDTDAFKNSKKSIVSTNKQTKISDAISDRKTDRKDVTSENNSKSGKDRYRSQPVDAIAKTVNEKGETAQQKIEEIHGIAEQVRNTDPIATESDTNYTDPTISDAIEKNEKTEVADVDPEKKSIFDVIQEEEDEEEETKVASTNTKRWKVAPTVAPVYYNSLGNGSSVDGEFVDNTKQGQVNMSYGVQIAYAINKKLSVRSGVNSVNLGYGTQDVGFSPSSSAQSLQNVSYGSNSQAILVTDYNPNNSSRSLIASETNSDQKSTIQNKGVLNLVMNYIEIPMEMKYALVDKKLGINLIGGVSTLFLQDNQLSIDAGNFSTDIGETTNLNEVSFSSNIGVGIDYQLSDKFQVQMEPIFKYQINAYDNTSGNFNPYYFGIYTGVSYRF